MSIGLFLGFRAAWIPGAEQPVVELAAVDAALRAAGLRPYREDPDAERVARRYETLHGHARSAFDHSGSGSLRALGALGVHFLAGAAGPLADLAECAELRFVPGEFPQRLEAPALPSGTLWSTGALLAALRSLAPHLGVPLDGDTVTDEVADALNAYEPLGPEDDGALRGGPPGDRWDLREDHRANWLALFEFARVAHAFDAALVLGG